VGYRAAPLAGEIGSYPRVSVATMSRFKTDSSSPLTDLAEKVAEILSILPDRERRVLHLRYGLCSGKALTLEEVGRRLDGMTREGVRQVEKRAMGQLQGQCGMLAGWTHTLNRRLAELGGVAYLHSLVDALDRRASHTCTTAEPAVRLVLRLDERFIRVGRNGGGEVWALKQSPVQTIAPIQAFGVSILRNARLGLSVRCLVKRIMRKLGTSAPNALFVGRALSVSPTVTMSHGYCFLSGANRRRAERRLGIVRILSQEGGPLHFTVIADSLNQGGEKESSPRAVSALLRRESEVFVRVRRGVYDLKARAGPTAS